MKNFQKYEKYLIIEKIRIGYRIKDTLTNNCITYACYNLKNAIHRHRQINKLKYLHFEKIYI